MLKRRFLEATQRGWDVSHTPLKLGSSELLPFFYEGMMRLGSGYPQVTQVTKEDDARTLMRRNLQEKQVISFPHKRLCRRRRVWSWYGPER